MSPSLLATVPRLILILTALIFGLNDFVNADPVVVSVPPTVPARNAVQSNFLGISLELSFLDEYFGVDTDNIPPTVLNYLSAIRNRTGSDPLRLRVGGNSMDSSTYVPELATPMLQLSSSATQSDDQSAKFGPMIWKVMKKVSAGVGGAEYLVGLSLRDPNDMTVPILAGDAEKELGSDLDGFLLGNEPDLYTPHQHRTWLKNYTTDIYIDEFKNASDRLRTTPAGDILNLKNLGGPTICCAWNLDALLQGGYLSAFSGILKYISLQHYPQDNCFNGHAYELPYYMQHANVVRLASWQQAGLTITTSNTAANHPRLIMSEFNSASCGGIIEISNTFVVGSLWTVDYALQMATVGYTAAYLHTRERGISYNLFTPPDGPNGGPGPWVTNPPYYALLATAEALQTSNGNGAVVIDLNIANSMTDKSATASGYAVYDSTGANVQRFVLFNYANVSTATSTFTLPASAFAAGSKKTGITVKYMSAQTQWEPYNIAWGGQSFAGVSDGIIKDTTAVWAVPNKALDCTNGCSLDLPPTTMAIVFVSDATKVNTAAQAPPNTTQTKPNQAGGKGDQDNRAWSLSVTSPLLLIICAGLFVLI